MTCSTTAFDFVKSTCFSVLSFSSDSTRIISSSEISSSLLGLATGVRALRMISSLIAFSGSFFFSELEKISNFLANRETRSMTVNGSKRNLSLLKPVSLEGFLSSFIVFLALEKPVAEFSHDGLVAKLTATSSPAAAKLTYAIYQCPANEIELKKPGTKENREMVQNLKQKCVKAKIYGDKHFIERKLARGFLPIFGGS